MESTPLELTYIAGFFDGEGSVSFIWPKGRNGVRYGRLVARITQKDPEILYWIKEIIGYGGVYEEKSGKTGYCSNYCVTSAQARKFLHTIRPYLRVKGERVDEKLELDRNNCVPHK